MYFITTLIISISILLGCSTTNRSGSRASLEFRPPEVATWPINETLTGEKDFDSVDLYLNRIAKENPGQTTTWWVDYRRAQLWSQKDKNIACENYSRLAGDPNFPIRRLAYLRAHEVCPKENQILARLETFDLKNFDTWLSDSALDVAILKAEKKRQHRELIDLYLKKSKLSLRKEEKVQLTQKALSFAKRLGELEKQNELQSRVIMLSPSREPKPKRNEYLAVANDYRYRREFDKALTYYKKIIANRKFNISEKIQAFKGIRTTYKLQQDRESALKAAEELGQYVKRFFIKNKKDKSYASIFADAQLLLARAYWTDSEVKRAQTTLDLIIKLANKKTSLAEVYWMRGRMNEEKQKYKEAVEQFKLALTEKIDSRSFRDKLNWYLAWNLRKTENYKEASEILKNLKKNAESPYEKSRYSFWLAKTYGQENEKSDAEDELDDLIDEDPLNFYGLLAHRELNRAIPIKLVHDQTPTPTLQSLNLNKELNTMVDANYFTWLVATKETKVAEDYLNSVSAQLRKVNGDSVDSWSRLFNLYSLSHNYQGLFTQLSTLENSIRRSVLEKNPTLIFPNPYFETVNQAAGRFGISPEFIYSIMRQESAFNPQARSHMDAFGLMQLLPQVAKKSAEANSIDYSNPDDLYSPHINIPLGSAHLRELWDRYNGEIILAAASYNASERAILGWLNTRYRGDTLEFIEDIPYDETRDYVKLVLRNLVTYQIISAQEDRFSFPEWTLKISAQK